MKKIISLFIIALFTMNLGFSQDNKEEKTNDKKAPEIAFEKLIHDYGTIEKGANGVCEFVFTNTGKEPLILSNVRSSCGCTVPSWPKEPIKKKKSAVIKVKYNTNRVGTISKSITVYSNAKNSPIRLKITGKVVDKPVEKVTSPVLEKNKVSVTPRIDNQ